MRWNLCTVGKPSLDYAKSGSQDYLKRIQRYTKIDWNQIREAGRESNSEQLLKSSQGSLRIVFDERGDLISTKEWVRRIDGWEMDGTKTVSLIIGGAEGHSRELRESADCVWSLSGLVMQHELALLVVLEGLYRCYTIKRGEPYHRD
tara:strand:+ start:7829 stop:8269 length:441 start_codon:yes stop_codon:yes gene_type:complete